MLARSLLGLSFCIACAAPAPVQRPADPAAVAHWRSLRFGMFVHWGPVSLTGKEIGWSRGNPTPIEAYDSLFRRFDPELFDARAWVAAARAAGMRYLVFTTKHHDGFCMWPSAHTDYDIAGSPFRRDVVGELAAACRGQGLEFGTYYSVPDWHHPDYPKGSPAGRSDKPDPDPERYARYLRDQVTELMQRYGPLLTMWFDMPREFGPEHGIPVVDMLRKLQPDIVVNDRAYMLPDRSQVGDYDTPEQRIGGYQRGRPWETCMTLCRQWAWKPDDRLKSLDECVRVLVQTIGGDGNLLLNVGPMPDGRIEPRQVERLRELGQWVGRYREAIYGTRGGPYLPGPWGASTCKGKRVFLFVLRWPETGPLRLPAIGRVTSAEALSGGVVVLAGSDEHLELDLPVAHRAKPTVLALTLDGTAFDVPPVRVPVEPSGSLAVGAKARASNTFRRQARFGPDKTVDDDPTTRWATDSGTKSAWLQVDLGAPSRIARIAIDEPARYARVREFELLRWDGARWRLLHRGTTIGPEWSLEFEPITAQRLRLQVLRATDGPTLAEFQVFAPRKH